ncbi:MAG: hypothetical protein ACK5LY_02935 [Lachnospirales bacterium]
MNFNDNYNTNKDDNVQQNKFHSANIELAKRIKFEISHFFDESNSRQYLKYFTEDEAASYRTQHFGKKNAALTTILAEQLNMSEKTFYHMQKGRNSQFDKIVGVLDFFELSFNYDIFSNKKSSLEKKENLILNEFSDNISDLEKKAILGILSLDEDLLLSLIPIIEHLSTTSKKNTTAKKNIYSKKI